MTTWVDFPPRHGGCWVAAPGFVRPFLIEVYAGQIVEGPRQFIRQQSFPDGTLFSHCPCPPLPAASDCTSCKGVGYVVKGGVENRCECVGVPA